MRFIKVAIVKIINLSLVFNLFLMFVSYLKTLFKFILSSKRGSNNSNINKLVTLRFIILFFIKVIFKK